MALELVGSDPSAGAPYPHVPPNSINRLVVFPAVGIARFGDSITQYFLAPEIPGHTSLPAGIDRFRDDDQHIRRQAVRFRVYAYDADNNVLGEVNNQNGYNLTWTVHVKNTKGAHTKFRGRLDNPNPNPRNPGVDRNRLIVDPGPREISRGAEAAFVDLRGTFRGSNDQVPENNVCLGQLQTDDAGRLIFVPGTGEARSVRNLDEPLPDLNSAFDNTDWYDTACDGWVRVQVTAEGFDPKESEHAATVVSGPPNFAWGINTHCSLYDVMENIYWGSTDPRPLVTYDFVRDIWPVLKSASLISWTNNDGYRGHGLNTNRHFTRAQDFERLGNSNFRRQIFDILRQPDYENPDQATSEFMPYLSGDAGFMQEGDIRRFAALTKLQYERFRVWAGDDNFTLPAQWPPVPNAAIEEIDLQNQPETLTRASLESTVGDALFPGIEFYWVVKLQQTYNLNVPNLDPPFRVDHPAVEPGQITEGLSLPWQSDFFLCKEHPWWPSVRPDHVATRENNIVARPNDWTRGLLEHADPGHNLAVGNLRGNTQMTRYWDRLGIVREVDNGELFVEGERRLAN